MNWYCVPGIACPRNCAGLTQAGLAERMGTSESAVARLESGTARSSVATLEKPAAATGSKLRIALEPA